MNSPITPATTATLRELLARIDAPLKYDTCSASPASWFCDKGTIRYEEHGGPLIEGGPDACRTIVAAINAVPMLLDQLAAQAAEIERVRAERDNANSDAQYCRDTLNTALRSRESYKGLLIGAEARVAELERELAATVKAKQENDERFMIERDEARCRAKELEAELATLERELADLAEGWDVEAERTEPSTEYADRIDALRECAAALRAALAK